MDENNIQNAENATENVNDGNNQDVKVSFDDVIASDKTYQAELDRRIQKAISKSQKQWEANKAKEIEDARTEAAKLAKMTRDEKAEYDYQKRIEALEARELEITKRELKGQAIIDLTENGLPAELAEILNYKDAESCKASIDAVKSAFSAAIEKAVEERLKGATPKAGGRVESIDPIEAIMVERFGDTYK